MAALFCWKCGTAAEESQSYCSSCGVNLFDRPDNSQRPGFWQRKTPLWAWIVIVLPCSAMVLLVVVSLFVPKAAIQRQAAREQLEKRCAIVLADSPLGEQRTTLRAMCDAGRKELDAADGRL